MTRLLTVLLALVPASAHATVLHKQYSGTFDNGVTISGEFSTWQFWEEGTGIGSGDPGWFFATISGPYHPTITVHGGDNAWDSSLTYNGITNDIERLFVSVDAPLHDLPFGYALWYYDPPVYEYWEIGLVDDPHPDNPDGYEMLFWSGGTLIGKWDVWDYEPAIQPVPELGSLAIWSILATIGCGVVCSLRRKGATFQPAG